MLAEDLVRRFYQWERRGRGWDVMPDYVMPEPVFIPFRGHYISSQAVDDGRKPTFLSGLARNVVGVFQPESNEHRVFDVAENLEEKEPVVIEPSPEWCELRVILPERSEVSKDALEQLFVSLSLLRGLVAFEIVGTGNSIFVELAVGDTDKSNVLAQLRSHLPGIIIRRGEGGLRKVWQEGSASESLVVDFGLSREFMLPLSTVRNPKVDPLTGIFGIMEGLRENEVAVYQVLLQPVREPWSASVCRSVTLADGSPLFGDHPEFLAQTRTKISRPLFAAVIRVGVKADEWGRVLDIARNIAGALFVFSNPAGNELIPLDNDGFDDEEREAEVTCRATRRSGMILNLDELIALVHPPGPHVPGRKLERQIQKTKAAPKSQKTMAFSWALTFTTVSYARFDSVSASVFAIPT